MVDSYESMESFAAGGFKGDEVLFLALTAIIAAGVSFTVFLGCYWWFRREQRRSQKKFLQTLSRSGRKAEDLFLVGSETEVYGELVARFKVNHGKQVVSLLESEGRRFIHVDGEFSAVERAQMVRYLKSEGFMS